MTQGFLNVLKPPGMTSHDIVSAVRRMYGLKRVGHTGTLDPSAAGVLPVGLGMATRLIEYLDKDDKAYRAEITFGWSSDTGDDTGNEICRMAYTMPTEEEIVAVLNSFEGDIEQLPPMYSAIKINGKKLYELAREGKEIERTPRPVRIHKITLIERRDDAIVIDVDCSKGTYIRTLCIDIGEKLGIPTVLSFLLRTRAGKFALDSAKTLEELAQLGENALLQMDQVLSDIPSVQLTTTDGIAFENGRTVGITKCHANRVRVYIGDRFVGIARVSENGTRLIPEKVFHLSADGK